MTIKRSVKILCVEDDQNLGATLSEQLNEKGFSVIWVMTKKEAIYSLEHTFYDLALIDIMLPDGLGYEIAEYIVKKHLVTAMIFLTALSHPDDRVKGLTLGAEDYIVKPFQFKELFLRINNALKRSLYIKQVRAEETPQIQIGKAILNLGQFVAHVEGEKNTLTEKECKLLRFLLDRRGKVVSREDILNHVWQPDEYPTSRTVDNFIMRLRRLIEKDPSQPVYIKSVRGIGYQLLD